MLIITIIGGDMPLLVPTLQEFVGFNTQVSIDITIQSPYIEPGIGMN